MAHWYTTDGSPDHGGDIRKARKGNLLPSVTGILGLLDKPALTVWKIKECLKLAFKRVSFAHLVRAKWVWRVAPGETEYKGEGTFDDFIAFVVSEQRRLVMEKADEGGDIHGYLERWPIDGETGSDTDVICRQVYDLIESETGLGPRRWSTETRFADTVNWFAGMCDLHCAAEPYVIDFKTKDTAEDVQKAYGGWHKEQLHAYAHGLGIPGAQLAVVFVSRDPSDWGKPEAVKFSPVQNDPLVLHGFLLLCQRWQVEKKHGPYYEKWAEHYKALEN